MERNNFRPISILPILSKVLERFVHSNFLQYLEHYKLISIAESGFRKLHSIVTALLNVTDKWPRNIDFCLNYQCLESHEWNFDGFRAIL